MLLRNRLQRYDVFSIWPNLLRCFFVLCLLVAVAAEGLVLVSLAQKDALVVLYGAVAEVCQVAAAYADGMYLGDVVGNGTECWHGAEGNALVVHVESCDDDAHTSVCQLVADVDESFIEELRFVNAHDVDVAGE